MTWLSRAIFSKGCVNWILRQSSTEKRIVQILGWCKSQVVFFLFFFNPVQFNVDSFCITCYLLDISLSSAILKLKKLYFIHDMTWSMARRNQQMDAHNIRYILVVLKWAVTWIPHPHSKKDGYKNNLKKWSQKIRQYFVFVGFMSWSSFFSFFFPNHSFNCTFLLMFISSDSVAKLGVILRYPSKGSFKHCSKKIGILSFFFVEVWLNFHYSD